MSDRLLVGTRKGLFEFAWNGFALGALILGVLAGPARADIIFDFTGTCTLGCTGTATGKLTLSDTYVFGSPIDDSSFISFTYSSSDLVAIAVPPADPAGGLNADGTITDGGISIPADL